VSRPASPAKTRNPPREFRVLTILQSIHTLAPNAKIYLADYPLLFGTNFTSDCFVGTLDAYNVPVPFVGHDTLTLTLSRTVITWLNLVGTVLDDVIKSAAVANDATFVDANPNFKSHRFCDTSNSWFNPVSGTYDDTAKQPHVSPGSFHPIPAGQQSGYEAAFQSAGL